MATFLGQWSLDLARTVEALEILVGGANQVTLFIQPGLV